MTHLACYSALYGGYDLPKRQPDLGCPMVMYTDDPYLDAPGWEVRVEPLPNVAGPMMRSRLWKCRPDLAVPEAEVTVWIDASLTVTRTDLAATMHRRLGNRDALMMRHPWRSCIYPEADAAKVAPKHRDQPLHEQVEHYRSLGHPPDWGLVACTMMVRRNCAAVSSLGDAWWHEQQRWSYHDQLALPHLLRLRPSLEWGWIEDPWEHWWTISPHEW